jgi:hypothetical protein
LNPEEYDKVFIEAKMKPDLRDSPLTEVGVQ